MNPEITLRIGARQLMLALAVAVALLIAYLLGGRGTAPAAAAPAASTPTTERTISLAGSGTAQAVPDELTFDITVARTDTDTSTAMAGSSRTMRAVLHALGDHGVARKDVASTDLSVAPTYRYTSGGQEIITGYRASQSVRVTVHDLAKAGKLISTAVATGGNQTRVDGISLRVAHPERAEALARKAAIADARAKAAAYAGATGQRLGDVLRIAEVRKSAPVEVPFASAGNVPSALDALKAAPVRVGRQPVTASITVVWQLR
jgi:uncharacterized protein YggE